MKIFIVVSRLPHPMEKADGMTVYWMMKFLAPRHDIHLACFYDDEKQLEFLPELEKYCSRIETHRHSRWSGIRNILRTLFRRDIPFQVAYYHDPAMERTVRRMVEEQKPDLIYCQLIRPAQYVVDLQGPIRVLAMQISQTLNYRRMIGNVSSLFYKILYTIEHWKVRRFESEIPHRFDSCLLISKHDKQAIDGHEEIDNIFFCPHGIDVAYYTPTGSIKKENRIVFSGFVGTPTNIDTITYFYEDIYPMVKARVPDVRLFIIGKDPAKSIREMAEKDPSVEVTGFVEDMRSYYEPSKVGIDSLRIGAGMQNKLITGMCMGVPMVATSIANEGIGAEPGVHVILADEPRAFADAVVELLTNEEKAATIAKQAREFVEKYWTWEYHFQRLEDHFEALVRNSPRRETS